MKTFNFAQLRTHSRYKNYMNISLKNKIIGNIHFNTLYLLFYSISFFIFESLIYNTSKSGKYATILNKFKKAKNQISFILLK